MSEASLEPLADDLRALLDLEKVDYAFNPALKAEVLSHVELAVGLAGTTAAAAGTVAATSAVTAGVGLKTAVAIGIAGMLLGGGIGASAVALTTRVAPQVVTTPHEPVPVREPAAAIAATASATAVQEIAPVAVPTQAAVTATATGPSSAPFRDLSKEREILDVARAALGRGRPSDAITAAQEHAQKWPRGYLVEEREVVLIQALAAAGRKPEAERKATQFRKFFPKSMLLPAVAAATGQ
jgi:hypothetical protein